MTASLYQSASLCSEASCSSGVVTSWFMACSLASTHLEHVRRQRVRAELDIIARPAPGVMPAAQEVVHRARPVVDEARLRVVHVEIHHHQNFIILFFLA